MAWRDDLQGGSFRGVPFYTQHAGGKIGRRVQLVEYPLKDTPNSEDMGRKARSFSIEAFVLGADYMSARDALIDALEAQGPGELVHPYRGRQNVVVTDASVEESPAEGGMARFTIEFTEAGANLYPASRVDAAAQLQAAADDATDAAQADFLSSWLPGTSGAVLQDALATAQVAFDWVDQHLGLINDAQAMLDNLIAPIQSLISQPLALYQRLVGSLERIKGTLTTPLTGLTAFSNVQLPSTARQAASKVQPLMSAALPLSASGAGLASSTSNGQTATGGTSNQSSATSITANAQIAANQQAMQTAVQTIAAIQVASTLPDVPVIASADLEAVRDVVLAALDELAEVASDATYPKLIALKAAAIKAVADRLPTTLDLATVSTHVAEPSLVIAWRKNAALDAEADLVARNAITHPGFVPGGASLAVLV